MGKVIINKLDATQTASKKSQSPNSVKSASKTHPKISRFNESAQSVGVKMNTKSKDANSSATAKSSSQKANENTSVKVTTVKARPVAHVNGKAVFGLPAGEADATKNTKKVVTQAKIVERTRVRVNKTQPQVAQPRVAAQKPGNKAGRSLDPELALLANRTSSAERSRVDTSRSGKSMSGVVGGVVRHNRPTASAASFAGRNPNRQNAKSQEPREEDLRFTKFKSALIGVGVAVVVAVIGFVCIGIFSGGKNMCTVLFESNGGSKVAGTEIVCGRTVKRPEDPTKEGFSFQGWTYEGDIFDFDKTSLYKNATLVARWKADDDTEIVTVSFDTNGGSSMSPIEIAKGRKLNHNSVSTPSRSGYIFEDWYLDDNVYDFDQPVEESITLRAEWSKRQVENNPNNSTPPATKVSSITATGDQLIDQGKTVTINVNVLPSAASFALAVSSSDDNVVSCSMSGKTAITCTAKGTGIAKVKVRDADSGVSTQFTVTVPANDIPPVNDDPVVTPGPGNNPGNDDPGNNDDNNNNGDDNNNGGDDNPGGDNNNNGGDSGDNGGNGDNTGGDSGEENGSTQ